MRKIFLHIGYPKSFSTTLQRSYFEVHPEIAFGGVGIGDDISYADKGLEFVFECLLKYCHQTFYSRHAAEAKGIIKNFIDKCPENHVPVFSSEYLIFPGTLQQIDPREVFRRIRDLFEGYAIHLLIVLRRQDSFLRSLYGETLLAGSPSSYAQYIRWIWGYRDRNFWEVLDYASHLKTLVEKFGCNRIHIYYFENWKNNPEVEINRDLSALFKISNPHLPIKNNRPSLKQRQLYKLLQVNKKFRREMGKHMMAPFENHRNRVVLERLNAGYHNDEVFRDVLDRRKALWKMIRKIGWTKKNLYSLTPDADEVYGKMVNYWKKANCQLRKQLPDLPEGYDKWGE